VQDVVPFPQSPPTVTETGEAGRFDLRLVASVTSTSGGASVLHLDHALSANYRSGSLRAAEICRVPYFDTLTVVGTAVPSMPWNGNVGGVIALRANAIAFAGGSIDVSSAGFAGGLPDGSSTGT